MGKIINKIALIVVVVSALLSCICVYVSASSSSDSTIYYSVDSSFADERTWSNSIASLRVRAIYGHGSIFAKDKSEAHAYVTNADTYKDYSTLVQASASISNVNGDYLTKLGSISNSSSDVIAYGALWSKCDGASQVGVVTDQYGELLSGAFSGS